MMTSEIRLIGKRHVKPSQIVRLKADANYTEISLEDGEQIIISKTLKEMEKTFTHFSFFRTHKSYMINLDHIASIQMNGGTKTVRLINNLNAEISRRRKDAFLDAVRSRA
ncbi:LytTR family DNA-binding domain-containing protein [uncultured Arcticibacterium sp.]|uniref:LytR/AlgR family response regulator transcription factor n=1 Tax=uncultured Arcticibacterium sp. TaxID=2173042 RepID=UPI0030FAA6C3